MAVESAQGKLNRIKVRRDARIGELLLRGVREDMRGRSADVDRHQIIITTINLEGKIEVRMVVRGCTTRWRHRGDEKKP
jgi:hypothetical protein